MADFIIAFKVQVVRQQSYTPNITQKVYFKSIFNYYWYIVDDQFKFFMIQTQQCFKFWFWFGQFCSSQVRFTVCSLIQMSVSVTIAYTLHSLTSPFLINTHKNLILLMKWLIILLVIFLIGPGCSEWFHNTHFKYNHDFYNRCPVNYNNETCWMKITFWLTKPNTHATSS